MLTAVIFDWAGTVVDFGSRAPMGAFVEAFGRFGVTISIAEARKPMGLPKRPHVQALIYEPAIAERWAAVHGRRPTERDVDGVYEVFVPLNVKAVTECATLVPGAMEVITSLRDRGLKIGSTTGYTRDIMAKLLPLAAAQGYLPDNVVCAGDLPSGRPGPLMMWKCFVDLAIEHPWTVVKVDDTAPGIAEGLAAGTWTVGVAMTGNAVGLTQQELEKLSAVARAQVREAAYSELQSSGAHFTIDSVSELMPVVDAIEARLAAQRRP